MSRTIDAQIKLRELILNGDLQTGERVREVALAERLGTSRTPIRAAMVRLAEEGLLERSSSVGYVVREFTLRDIEDAIEVRGTIEGVAARMAAERGVTAAELAALWDMNAQFDRILVGGGSLSSDQIDDYFELNGRFHDLLRALVDSFVIEHMYSRISALPFASPTAFVIGTDQISQTRVVLEIGQSQHRALVEAIERRQGSRAESVAREHARLALRTLKEALRRGDDIGNLQGSKLIDSEELRNLS